MAVMVSCLILVFGVVMLLREVVLRMRRIVRDRRRGAYNV